MYDSMGQNNFYLLRKYVSGTIHDLENLANKNICCVSPKKFNDPVDTYFYWLLTSLESKSPLKF